MACFLWELFVESAQRRLVFCGQPGLSSEKQKGMLWTKRSDTAQWTGGDSLGPFSVRASLSAALVWHQNHRHCLQSKSPVKFKCACAFVVLLRDSMACTCIFPCVQQMQIFFLYRRVIVSHPSCPRLGLSAQISYFVLAFYSNL